MNIVKQIWCISGKVAEFLAPLVNIAVRIELFNVFFHAGLLKIQSWDSTLSLFSDEYQVPLLPSDWAAILGTGVEIIIPFFILLGLAGRLPTLILFVFNIMAVVSYPFLWQQEGGYGLQQHLYWGLMLAFILFYSTGPISLDRAITFLRKRKT